MKESKIISYLKSLAHLDPDKNWLQASREELTGLMKHTSLRRDSVFTSFSFLRNMQFAATTLALLLFLGTGTGVAFASQDSLPGDTLFPVKLFTEEVEKFLARDDLQKVELSIKFANRRLEEVIKLTVSKNQRGRGREEIGKNLKRFELTIKEGQGFLAKLEINNKQNKETLKLVLKFNENFANHQEILEQLEGLVPEEAKEAIRLAKEASLRGEAVSFKLTLKIENESEEEDEEGEENGEEDENQKGEERNIQGSIGVAKGKIGAATNKIDAVERKISREKEKKGEEFTSMAQSKLDEAKLLLEEVQLDFEDEEFLSAFEKAQQVIRLSQDAQRLLKEDIEDEQEDEGNNEEDGDENENEDSEGEENGEEDDDDGEDENDDEDTDT